MPLDSQVAELLKQLEAEDLESTSRRTIQQARERYLELRGLAGDPKDLYRVKDIEIPGAETDIPARLYIPGVGEQLPTLVYCHGGRFISGDLETHDALCRDLADRSGCCLMAVDYRLAPENRFPAALEDCYSAACWAASHGDRYGIDRTRLGVGGDSAGGGLAAAVALLARKRETPQLAAQMLIYPMLDATCSRESHQTFRAGPGAGSESMREGYEEYLKDSGQDLKSPLVSPFWEVHLTDLPHTFMLTAEYDSLRDEGEEYALRLRQSGTRVTSVAFSGAIHGFFQMAGALEIGDNAVQQAAEFLRETLGKR